MEVYKHGVSFRNPKPMPIAFVDSEPSFIEYSRPATKSTGVFSTRRPAWAATSRRYIPRGGFEMIRDTPEVDGLGSWFGDMRRRAIKRRPIAATGRSQARGLFMARRKAALVRPTGPGRRDTASMFRGIRKRAAWRNLGLSGISDTPTFGELALGQAQAPTATSGTVVRSSVTGFLQNLLTTGAHIYKTAQETKLQQLKAQVQAGESAMMESFKRPGTLSMPMILGIGGAALLATTLLMKKKRG